MFTFLLWCILFVACWPLALLALVLYPFVWILLLPFRLVGIAVHGALAAGLGGGYAAGTAAKRTVPDLRFRQPPECIFRRRSFATSGFLTPPARRSKATSRRME